MEESNKNMERAGWPLGWDLHHPTRVNLDYQLQLGHGAQPHTMEETLAEEFGIMCTSSFGGVPESLISNVSRQDLGEFIHIRNEAGNQHAAPENLKAQENLPVHPFLAPMTRTGYRASTFTSSETGEFPNYRGYQPHLIVSYMDHDGHLCDQWDQQQPHLLHPSLGSIKPVGFVRQPSWCLSDRPEPTRIAPVGNTTAAEPNTAGCFLEDMLMREERSANGYRYFITSRDTDSSDEGNQPDISPAEPDRVLQATKRQSNRSPIDKEFSIQKLTNVTAGFNKNNEARKVTNKISTIRKLDEKPAENAKKAGGDRSQDALMSIDPSRKPNIRKNPKQTAPKFDPSATPAKARKARTALKAAAASAAATEEDPEEDVEFGDDEAAELTEVVTNTTTGQLCSADKHTLAIAQGAKPPSDEQAPNIWYMCATGVGYTGNDEAELVEHEDTPNYTRNDGVMTYQYIRRNKPHEMFPPCTCCSSALLQASTGDEPQPCRLDDTCPLHEARGQALCIDCGEDLMVCHNGDCPEPTKSAAGILAQLWRRACETQQPHPVQFWNHWPALDSQSTAWAATEESAVEHLAEGNQDMEQEMRAVWNLAQNNRTQYHITKYNDGVYTVRRQGGTATMLEANVDTDLIANWHEREATRERISPQRLQRTPEENEAHYARLMAAAPQRPSKPIKLTLPDASPEQDDRTLHETIARLQAQLDGGAHPPSPQIDRLAQAMMQQTANIDKLVNCTQQQMSTPPVGGLLSPEFERLTGDLYAEVMRGLNMASHLTRPASRPSLQVLIAAANYSPVYPFFPRTGSALSRPIDGWTNSNIVKAAFVERERNALTATSQTAEESLTLSSGKVSGLVLAAQGTKPVLPNQNLKKIDTYVDLNVALENLSNHYDETGDPTSATRIQNHRKSMRALWVSLYHFHNEIAIFLVFEQALRSFRVSSPTENAGAMWTLDETPGSQEMHILNEALLQVNEARMQKAINSSGPRNKVQPAGPEDGNTRTPRGAKGEGGRAKRGGGKAKPCEAWAAGTCTDAKCKLYHANNYKGIPEAFDENTREQKPQICSAYAYYGRCGRSAGDSCKSIKGNKQLHTCSLCKFAKGKHAINKGSCPH